MKRGLLAYLTPIVGLGLAGIAAVISIIGMSKLFAGQATIVMVVMALIEAGKVLGTSVLHNKWKDKSYKFIRWLLLLMVFVSMIITSWGIYGFFTDAYQKTAGELSINEKEISLIENKKSVFTKTIENIEGQIEFKNEQSQNFIDLRTQQELRLDSLLANNHWTNAKRTQEQIEEANADLKRIQGDIDTMYMEIIALNDSIGKLDIQILEKQSNSEASAELGPLIYIARVFDKEMDDIINFVMWFIMFVFDPFAIILIVVTNKMWERKKDSGGEITSFEPVKPLPSVLPSNETITPITEIIEETEVDPIEEDDLEDVITNPPKKVEELQETVDNEEPKKDVNLKPEEPTPGEDLDNRLQKILKNRKRDKGNNNIMRLGGD